MVWRCSAELTWEEVSVLEFLSSVGGEPHSPLEPKMQEHLASALRKISASIVDDLSDEELLVEMRGMMGTEDV